MIAGNKKLGEMLLGEAAFAVKDLDRAKSARGDSCLLESD
jgi:hypothetical protein